MNGRNCQLCGKPLSRLRVGGDGDFCSKEHRNQFRLRAGMDRLVEVNKVASLMRRREAARQIPPANLMRSGSTDRHEFGLMPARLSAAPQLIQLQLAKTTAPVLGRTGACASPQATAIRGRVLEGRFYPAHAAITISGAAPLRIRLKGQQIATSFARRESCELRWGATEAAAEPRTYLKTPPQALRTHLGGKDMLRNPQRLWTGVASKARSLTTAATEGQALRVSIGLAFRVPKVRQPERKLAPQAQYALLPVTRPQVLQPAGRAPEIAVKSLDIAMPEFALKLPAGPAKASNSAFEGSASMALGSRIFRDMPTTGPRTGAIQWAGGEPLLQTGRISQTASGFARRNGAHLTKLSWRPQFSEGEARLSDAVFTAREELVVPQIPYCNVLAAAAAPEAAPPEPEHTLQLVREPAPTPAEAVVRYEENFGNGWDNWVGGVADWKVDVAGVRTGSLALYLPTLELSDYDLEFLTRIDSRTVNWVVRAAGSEAHLRCTVTAVEGGQLVFSRAPVHGGTAEAAVVSATRVPGKPRATFTVRMSIAGPVFSITIDGKTIDSWVDDRLATGGIGFVGAPDDRARLYWVRVSSPAASNKEHIVQ